MLKHKKHKVLTLSDQCLIAFGNKLLKSINKQISKKTNLKLVIKQIKDYLTAIGADTRVRQELLDIADNSRSTLQCYLCYAILLDESTQVFGANLYWDDSNWRLWELIAQNCVNLRCLDLRHTYWTKDDMRYFEQILQNNTKLTQLTLPCDAETELMQALINKYCKQLKYLSIQNFDTIVQDAEFLSNSSNIANTLIKFDFSLSHNFPAEQHIKAVAKILQYCPNLQSLNSYSFVGPALEMCLVQNKQFQCNLRILCDNFTSQKTLATIIKTCPKLKQLTLITPQYESFKALENAKIHDLNIQNCCDCSELLKILKKSGKHLFGLSIRGCCQNLDLYELNKSCPMLARLEFEHLTNAQVSQLNEMFQQLRELRIHQSRLPDHVLAKLLRISQNLNILQINQTNYDDEFKSSGNHSKNLIKTKIEVASQQTIQTVKKPIEDFGEEHI